LGGSESESQWAKTPQNPPHIYDPVWFYQWTYENGTYADAQYYNVTVLYPPTHYTYQVTTTGGGAGGIYYNFFAGEPISVAPSSSFGTNKAIRHIRRSITSEETNSLATAPLMSRSIPSSGLPTRSAGTDPH